MWMVVYVSGLCIRTVTTHKGLFYTISAWGEMFKLNVWPTLNVDCLPKKKKKNEITTFNELSRNSRSIVTSQAKKAKGWFNINHVRRLIINIFTLTETMNKWPSDLHLYSVVSDQVEVQEFSFSPFFFFGMGVSSVSVTALPHHYSSQWDQMIRDGHGPGKQTTYLLFSFPPPLLFFHSRPVSSFTPRYTLYHYGSILLRSIHLRWCFPLSPITMAAAAEASYWSLYDIPREVEGERVWRETNVQREERMNSAQCH